MSFESVVLLKRFHLPECTAENDAVSVRIVAVLRKSKISQFLNGTKFMMIIVLSSFSYRNHVAIQKNIVCRW